ncbi:class I SAM-dependent methyltransferase [Halobacillus sp. A5]|uniref:class I SAM-dependent methyltransferase n=1 Tax=Halobacillus sp. A5 TaxID=2880263 RepID=UPI0020A6AC92|nr:class I SAM-dependent methyltransferase [Halobacillus sp. A5]MCP3026383.1 class I SAM-dependent methyltransferase [Halobacillus sp. A5]
MKYSPRETFDKLAKTYLNDIDHVSPYNAYYERPAMMNALPADMNGRNILDAGCSAGWYSEEFIKRGADKVKGFDLSPLMVEAANSRELGERADFICHDLQEPLPVSDHSIDVVVSSLTLHYLKEWDFVFEEFNRVLKQGGVFLYSTHHPFMDYTLNQCESYFQSELLTDTWVKPKVTIDVSFYSRSMQNIINVTNKHFTLEEVIEPQPVPKMKEEFPSSYQKLMTQPHFLIVKAVKC